MPMTIEARAVNPELGTTGGPRSSAGSPCEHRPLRHRRRADKYALHASKEGTAKLELLRGIVDQTLSEGRSLDEAVAKFSRPTRNRPSDPVRGKAAHEHETAEGVAPRRAHPPVEPRPRPSVDAAGAAVPTSTRAAPSPPSPAHRAAPALRPARPPRADGGSRSRGGPRGPPGARVRPVLRKDVDLFQIGPGLGLASGGEDVFVPRPGRIRVDQVLRSGSERAGSLELRPQCPPECRERGRDAPALPTPTSLDVQVPPGRRARTGPGGVPKRGSDNSDDQGQIEPDAYSFEDQQWVDGCTPVLFAWPMHWPMPDPAAPDWRSRLAWMIFDRSASFSTRRALLEQLGVPWPWWGSTPSMRFLPAPLRRPAAVVRLGERLAAALLPRGTRDAPALAGPAPALLRAPRLLHAPADRRRHRPSVLRFLPPMAPCPRTPLILRLTRRFFPSGFSLDAAPFPWSSSTQ